MYLQVNVHSICKHNNFSIHIQLYRNCQIINFMQQFIHYGDYPEFRIHVFELLNSVILFIQASIIFGLVKVLEEHSFVYIIINKLSRARKQNIICMHYNMHVGTHYSSIMAIFLMLKGLRFMQRLSSSNEAMLEFKKWTSEWQITVH